jgi:DNA mismatch repair ATPase MutS
MSKLIKELTKEWKEYREEVKKENRKLYNESLEQHEKESSAWKEMCKAIDKVGGCYTFPPFPRLPKTQKPTMEGFLDYLTNKQL